VGETPVGINTTAFGVLKFAELNRLKISTRNCSKRPSPNGVSWKSEQSHVAKPGIHVSRAQISVEGAVGRRSEKGPGVKPLVRIAQSDGSAEGRVDERPYRIARIPIYWMGGSSVGA